MTYDIISILGIVWILSNSKLFKPFRELITTKSMFIGKLLNCWGCTAFWVGVFYVGTLFLIWNFMPNHFRSIQYSIHIVFPTVFVAYFLQTVIESLKK